MTTLYIYTAEDNTLVARISGASNLACEAHAAAHYGNTDMYGWTYSPAFGFADGIIDNEDAEVVSV